MRVLSREHFGVLGQSRVGKSTLLASMVAALPKTQRVVVIDPANARPWDRFGPPRRWPGYLPEGVLRYVPPLDRLGHVVPEAVAQPLEAAYREGNTLVVADEVQDWPWLEAIARRGMQRGVGLWWASQYAVGVPRYLLSQSLFILSGYQQRQTDIRILEDATSVSWEYLPRLGPHDLAVYQRGARAVVWPRHLGIQTEGGMEHVQPDEGAGGRAGPGLDAAGARDLSPYGRARDARGRFRARAPA